MVYHFDSGMQVKLEHLFNICVILLLGTGLVTLYSASYTFAFRFFRDGNYFIKRQIVFAVLGIILFFIFSNISLDFLRKFVLHLIIIAGVLCLLSLIPGIGVERYGATRWIEIGPISYQPSELVKFVLPLYLAHLLDKKHKKNILNNNDAKSSVSNDTSSSIDSSFFSGFLPPVIITGGFFLLIHLQNNFSTAILIIINVLVIFFFFFFRYRYFLAAIVLTLPVSALLVFTREYRVTRLVSFIKPEWDPLGAGFQVNASREAIISGGFWGKGLGEGTRKLASIPEIHSDFIFSSYAEETGFIGLILLFTMFTAFAVFGYRAALKSNNVFGRLLAAGLTTTIIIQAILNISVVSGALPATGVPLPFFSAGGSSLATTLMCSGLIANIARRSTKSGTKPEISR